MKKTLHCIVNAHLDPVWLWDYREGLNEGLATCKIMLDLMDEFPQLTFIRGESAIYEHIEKYDPVIFQRIKEYVKQGRWDIVGGNYVQSDTNLPSTASLMTQYEIGQQYFEKTFGKKAKVAWAADSFGHSSNMPSIYCRNDLKYFCFSRPQESLLHLSSPLFYWQADDGCKVLCYRIENGSYQLERNNLIEQLELHLKLMQNSMLQHHCIFIGLGNHGGGSSRRHIKEVLAWSSQHPEIECRFSTLTDFFAFAEQEKNIPVFQGELNFALRGCHSSALGIKSKFRDMEKTLQRAMKIAPDADWAELLKGQSFNAFHDILPGSSIERTNQEQIEWMSSVIHQARQIEFDALNRKVSGINVRLREVDGDNPKAVPFFLFNPQEQTFRGTVELEACIDYRPRMDYINRSAELPLELMDGETPLAFQCLQTEHMAFEDLPWRKRVVFEVEIPPACGKIITLGYQEAPCTAPEPVWQNHSSVEVKDGVLYLNRNPFEVATYVDLFGSWGDMAETPEGYSCPEKFEDWKIVRHEQIYNGPICREEQIEYHGGRSTLILNLRRTFNNNDIVMNGKIIWQERNQRLRFGIPCGETITYQNPGGEITRSCNGDVPGGRYLDLHDGRVIVNDHFCGFTKLGSMLYINVIRGCLSASNRLNQGDLSRTPTDCGLHSFRLIFSDSKECAASSQDAIAVIMTYEHEALPSL